MPKQDGFVKVPNEYIQQYANNPEKIGAYVIAKQMEFQSPDGVVSPKEFGYRVGWDKSRSWKYLSGIRVLTSKKQLGNNPETPNQPPEPISEGSGNPMATEWQPEGSGDLILPLKTKTKTTTVPPSGSQFSYPPEFETLWKAYPKTNGAKKKAFDEFKKQKPDSNALDDWLDSIEKQLAYKQALDLRKEFVPEFCFFDRWIKERRWENKPEDTNHGRMDTSQPSTKYKEF